MDLDDPRLKYPYKYLPDLFVRRREANRKAMLARIPDCELGWPPAWDVPGDRTTEAAAAFYVFASVGIHVQLVRELGHGTELLHYLRHLWGQGRRPDTLYSWQLGRVCQVIGEGLLPGWKARGSLGRPYPPSRP